MKKIALLLFIWFFIGLAELYAHAPTDMKLYYDSETRILTVKIEHNVIDPRTHFIKRVVVKINGKAIYTHNIKRQDDKYKQILEYPILNVKNSDEILVEAYCNQGGKIQEDMVVTIIKNLPFSK
ncbi:MAG: hypothetical protein KBB01_02575 [Candidatus Omnitrophica bacterium]|jgi:hypothetical protein|nr:hypothetical protein [Candidatus Omnitrophota bacterium]